MVAVVDRVTRRMRAARRVGRTVVLRLRFDDFTRATRSHTVAQATADTRVVLTAARALLDAARPTIDERGLTCIGVAVTTWPTTRPSSSPCPSAGTTIASVDLALDRVRDRFGTSSVTRAVLLGRDQGLLDADAAGLIEGQLIGSARDAAHRFEAAARRAPGRAPRPTAARAAARCGWACATVWCSVFTVGATFGT